MLPDAVVEFVETFLVARNSSRADFLVVRIMHALNMHGAIRTIGGAHSWEFSAIRSQYEAAKEAHR